MGDKIFLKNLWRWKCGLYELEFKNDLKLNLNDLQESEWSKVFETLMRNRLVFGAIRYGKIGDPGKPDYDRCASIVHRLELYLETGNKELLVDIANLSLVEFEDGKHPNAHFKSMDDVIHVQIKPIRS